VTQSDLLDALAKLKESRLLLSEVDALLEPFHEDVFRLTCSFVSASRSLGSQPDPAYDDGYTIICKVEAGDIECSVQVCPSENARIESLSDGDELELDLKVPPHSFSPHPAVDSRMVKLTPDDLVTVMMQDSGHPLGETLEPADARFSRLLVRHCFEQRRKKLRNRLANPPKRLVRIPGWHRSRWSDAVQELSKGDELAGLPSSFLDLRPESLTQQEWLTLSSWLSMLEIGTLQAD